MPNIELNIDEKDIAFMMLVLGISGIIVQGGLLQPLVGLLGERGLLITSFACGTVHNLFYGIARTKSFFVFALVLSQFTKTNFPILSSVASKSVEASEQGRLQGALFATNAIANAIGPLTMEWVSNLTPHKGFMFIYAAGLYAIGTIVVAFIPSRPRQDVVGPEQFPVSTDLEEPVLDSPFASDKCRADELKYDASTGTSLEKQRLPL